MKKIKKLIIIIAISFIVLLLFSTSTSPLYGNYYEDDSSIFILMGKAILKGMIPYKDIFDHKGPVLFWLEAFGQKICEGRIGIFSIQVVMLSITNILFYKIAKNFCNENKAIYSVLFTMSIFSFFLEEGNLSEEFSLLFIAICLYIAIKWMNSLNLFDKKIYEYSFIYGISFSIVSLIRLNNVATICGLVLGIIIIFVKNNKVKELAKCALFFILGIILVYIPVLAYFYSKSATYDMLYGTFIHNFKYLKLEGNILLKIGYSVHIPILMLITYNINKENKNLNILIMCASIFTYIILFLGSGFSHYYILTVPLVIVYISQIWNIIEKNKVKSERILLYGIIIFIAIMYVIIKVMNSAYYIANIDKVTVQDVVYLTDKIPNEERNNVFIYNHTIASSIYLYSDLMPCYKYAFLQNKLFETNTKIEDETYEYFQNNSIKWIIGQDLLNKKSKNKIEIYILNNYDIVDSMIVKRLDFGKIVDEEIFLYKKLDNENNT